MKTKTVVFLSICTLLLAVGVGSAQQVSDQTMLTYEVLSQEWNKLIGGVLDLSEEQAVAFWPLYEEYRAARGALMQERIDVIKMFLSGYDTMDATFARGLLDATFQIDEKTLKVKREYAPRFDKVLTPAQVVRLYQTENRLEVMMMAEVTKDVPLAR